MTKTLHILLTPPEETVAKFIENFAPEGWVTVIGLYDDDVSYTPVNWHRLVDDIFDHDKVICWW